MMKREKKKPQSFNRLSFCNQTTEARNQEEAHLWIKLILWIFLFTAWWLIVPLGTHSFIKRLWNTSYVSKYCAHNNCTCIETSMFLSYNLLQIGSVILSFKKKNKSSLELGIPAQNSGIHTTREPRSHLVQNQFYRWRNQVSERLKN